MKDDELRLHLESLHASIFELHGVVSENSKQIEKLTGLLAQDAENIRALARIAEAHEHRLDDLEEQ
jgi:uncharacterized protein Yka (UPF0111/DUF47 family)